MRKRISHLASGLYSYQELSLTNARAIRRSLRPAPRCGYVCEACITRIRSERGLSRLSRRIHTSAAAGALFQEEAEYHVTPFKSVSEADAWLPPNKSQRRATEKSIASLIHMPHATVGDDVNVWLETLNKLLPPGLCKSTDTETLYHLHQSPAYLSTLTRVLTSARRYSGANLFVHLALNESRWDAFLWLSEFLIANLSPPTSSLTPSRQIYDYKLIGGQSLDRLTEHAIIVRRRQSFTTSQKPETVRELCSGTLKDPYKQMLPEHHAILGQIWYGVGRLLLEASKKDEDERQCMVSKSLLVVADLYRSGFIPEQVNQHRPNPDPTALVQPVLLQKLACSNILSLQDVVHYWQEARRSEDYDINISKLITPLPGIPMPDLSPEIWLEFVLWCCICGGWAVEGAAILQEMKRVPAPWRWRLSTYRRNIRSSTGTSELIAERELGHEVVLAIVDSIVTSLDTIDSHMWAAPDILKQLSALRECFGKDLSDIGKRFSWNALINRIRMTSQLHSPGSSEQLSLFMLSLADYGRKSAKLEGNVWSNGIPAEPLGTPAYINENLANVVGLYHQVLHTQIQAKNLRAVVKTLLRYLQFTDTVMAESLFEFLQKSSTCRYLLPDLCDGGFPATFSENGKPSILHPLSLHHSIPTGIIASLLNLISEQQLPDLGRWIILPGKAGRALLTAQAARRTSVTLSLIRFASATADTELGSRIASSFSEDVSSQNLMALCCLRIEKGDLNGATEMLLFVRNKRWNTVNGSNSQHRRSRVHKPAKSAATHFTYLVASTLKLAHRAQLQASVSGVEAATRFGTLLFNGTFGALWGPSLNQRDSIAAVASSTGFLGQPFTDAVFRPGLENHFDIPRASFNALLSATTAVGGSQAGRALWAKWCSNPISRQAAVQYGRIGPPKLALSLSLGTGKKRWQRPTEAKSLEKPINEAENLLRVSHDSLSTKLRRSGADVEHSQGKILPRLSNLRLIINAALREYEYQATRARMNGPEDQDVPSRDGKENTATRIHDQFDHKVIGSTPAPTVSVAGTSAGHNPMRHEVLDWAAKELKSSFGLGHAQISEELGGRYIPQIHHGMIRSGRRFL